MISSSSDPKIGVALGGGAARGLSHIPFMEAIDELGLTPSIISGTSIGSLLGAGWASGLKGREVREFAYEYLGSMRTIVGRIWSTRLRNFTASLRSGISMQLDALEVIESFVPQSLPKDISAMKIPLRIVATDFSNWHQVVFRDGPVVPAIAASVAIPNIFKPVNIDGRLLLDGSVVNPLPLDIASRNMDIMVAVDVNGSPNDEENNENPSMLEVGFGSAQIMMHGLITNNLAAFPPDVYVRPRVKTFGAMEFWRVKEIIESGEQDKEKFKRELAAAIENFISGKQKNA